MFAVIHLAHLVYLSVSTDGSMWSFHVCLSDEKLIYMFPLSDLVYVPISTEWVIGIILFINWSYFSVIMFPLSHLDL